MLMLVLETVCEANHSFRTVARLSSRTENEIVSGRLLSQRQGLVPTWNVFNSMVVIVQVLRSPLKAACQDAE